MTDDNIQRKSKQDQIMATWRDTIPPLLRSMYLGFIQAGFNPEQALDLTKHTFDTFNKKPPMSDMPIDPS